MPNYPHGIEPINITQFENRHQNFTQIFKNQSFHLVNPMLDNRWKEYLATTKNIQWLIKEAINKEWRLRAMGRGWSMSKVAVAKDGVIDTMDLRNYFNMRDDLCHSSLHSTARVPNLVFTQCGMSMFALNNKLEKEGRPRRSIRASGAANGQSIVGAFSTNTHGSAVRYGSVHDQVVGLHIVTGPDEHVWIERNSNPIVSHKFITNLSAKLLRSDDLFNAAIISFGSFGFIHGVMLETQPICLLKEYKKKDIAYDAVMKEFLANMNFDLIRDRLPGPYRTPGHKLYHFELGFNPHRFENDNPQKGFFMRVMYQTPYREDYKRKEASTRFQYGESTFGVLQTILDLLGNAAEHVIPSLVNTLYPLAYAETEPVEGTFGEHFGVTRVRGKASSFALGMDISDCTKVLEIVVETNKTQPFPGVTAMRFVKGTKATLGFTRFPITCVMELDAMDCNAARAFYKTILSRLESEGIPHTLHWGKVNYMIDSGKLNEMYGDNVNKWKDARNSLLEPEVQEVFNNQFMDRCGLSDPAFII
ncbi:MAG: FAD-binding protein [Flavobacteriaceae bacterium]